MKRLRAHGGLLAVLVAFFALGLLYQRVTPLLETPDEPSHFSIVQYVADHWRLPPARPAPVAAGPVPLIQPGPPVYYAPPLYYLLGAPLIADLDTSGFAAAVIPNPNWARGWAPTPGRTPENKHVYVHTADQRPPYAGWAAAMIRLRLFALLLGGATVAGVYALAHPTNQPPNQPTSQPATLVATALVAFNPAFLFVTSGVTNDALLCALSAWAFVLMARLAGLGQRPSPNSQGLVALLGVVLGLAALTKQSALVLLPAAALAVTWGAQSQPHPRRATLKWLLLLAVPVALLAGWWYLHNALAYGDPLGFQPHQTPTGEWRVSLSLLVRQLGSALQGYWGTFGWGLILVEPALYWLLAGLVLLSLWGWLRVLSAGRRPPNPHTCPGGQCQGSPILTILALGVSLNLLGLALWLWRTSAPYGRLLFPTLGPVAVLLTLGWERGLGRARGRRFARGVALGMALYAAVVPWRYLRPAYAHPVVSPSALEDATALDVAFDQTIRLLGYRLAPETARPGDQVTLTLYWQTTSPLNTQHPTNPTVFVQLAPQDPQQRVAGLDDYLGTTRYPASVWQPGEVIAQVHRLRLPQNVPAPALYWFNVGLYDAPGGERWPVTADGAPLPDRAVRLGPLRAWSERVQEPQRPVDYRFGSAIRLTGYDVDTANGASITVTLHWQANAAPGEDLTVFVHLLDGAGRSIAQHDGPPREGDYPTGAWQPGDRVPDPHTLALPPDLQPGTWELHVGLYRPADGTRIPAFDRAGQRLIDDVLPLTLTSGSIRDGN